MCAMFTFLSDNHTDVGSLKRLDNFVVIAIVVMVILRVLQNCV
jgi:hypothetical protein